MSDWWCWPVSLWHLSSWFKLCTHWKTRNNTDSVRLARLGTELQQVIYYLLTGNPNKFSFLWHTEVFTFTYLYVSHLHKTQSIDTSSLFTSAVTFQNFSTDCIARHLKKEHENMQLDKRKFEAIDSKYRQKRQLIPRLHMYKALTLISATEQVSKGALRLGLKLPSPTSDHKTHPYLWLSWYVIVVTLSD